MSNPRCNPDIFIYKYCIVLILGRFFAPGTWDSDRTFQMEDGGGGRRFFAPLRMTGCMGSIGEEAAIRIRIFH
jgi:hypothetical protein